MSRRRRPSVIGHRARLRQQAVELPPGAVVVLHHGELANGGAANCFRRRRQWLKRWPPALRRRPG